MVVRLADARHSRVVTSRAPSAAPPAPTDALWEWAAGATLVITALRLLAVRLSPLELYGDEAQYWLWSRDLAFGYFTKPPLLAWIIRLTTLPGNAEPFVRLSAPLLQGATGLFLYCAARRLYDSRTALYGLFVYALIPAVQLGSFVISTDTPLVACLAAALWAYVGLQQSEGRGRLMAAGALGLMLGLAFLAKYAALYSVIGVGLHLILSRKARQAWTLPAALIAIVIFALIIAPNLIWNATYGFASFGHLASEAAWGGRKGGPLQALAFLGSQFGVFGPVTFAILTGGAIWLAARRKLQSPDLLLLSWTAPALIIVFAQAFIAGAKANWAVAAFPPAAVLVAAWMLRWNRPRVLIAVLAVHAVVAAAGLAVLIHPGLADKIGLSSALKGVRGGRDEVRMLIDQSKLATLAGGPLSAAAIDDRELFNIAAYYGRDYFGKDGPPLKAWLAGPRPRDEAQLASPLTPQFGARVLMVSRDGVSIKAMRRQFQSAGEVDIGEIWLDTKHRRQVQTFVGQGFEPQRRPAAPPPAAAPPAAAAPTTASKPQAPRT